MLVKGRVKRDGVAQPLTNKTAKHDKGQEQPVFFGLFCAIYGTYDCGQADISLTGVWGGKPHVSKNSQFDVVFINFLLINGLKYNIILLLFSL